MSRGPGVAALALPLLATLACSQEPLRVGTVIVAQGPRAELRLSAVMDAPAHAANLQGPLLDALRRVEPLLRQCYVVDVAGPPSRGGVVILAYTLEPTGKAVGIRQKSSSLGDPRRERCLRDALWELKVAGPSRTTRVEVEQHVRFEVR